MAKIILYHGSPNKIVSPAFGLGEEKHDYGKGFYLSENKELAKEWAVCRPDEHNGWLHKYELDSEGLKILDFEKHNVLSWLAELMKHRDASDSKRYRVLARKFIDKYGIDTNGFDVIKGWRADASYFFIAREFVRDNVDLDILEKLLCLGDLGIQYCIKSEKAYSHLNEIPDSVLLWTMLSSMRNTIIEISKHGQICAILSTRMKTRWKRCSAHFLRNDL